MLLTNYKHTQPTLGLSVTFVLLRLLCNALFCVKTWAIKRMSHFGDIV